MKVEFMIELSAEQAIKLHKEICEVDSAKGDILLDIYEKLAARLFELHRLAKAEECTTL